jgi:hypothetical protein
LSLLLILELAIELVGVVVIVEQLVITELMLMLANSELVGLLVPLPF